MRRLTANARTRYIPMMVISDTRNINLVVTIGLFASIAWMGTVGSTAAQTCVPPPGFVDTPAPTVAAVKELVSHTEEITIDRRLAVVLNSIDKPLEDTIHKTNSLPGVSGSHMLTQGEFAAPARAGSIAFLTVPPWLSKCSRVSAIPTHSGFVTSCGITQAKRLAPSNTGLATSITPMSAAGIHT